MQSSPSTPSVDTLHLTATASSSASSTTSLSGAGTSAGIKASLFLDVTPKPRMHIYAPGEKDGIPIALTIEANPAITLTAPQYPAPEKFYFEPLKLTQLVYSKRFRITQPITIAARTSVPLTIKGMFKYQACDDTVCYLPKTVPVVFTIGSSVAR